jgi:hypothetical protein
MLNEGAIGTVLIDLLFRKKRGSENRRVAFQYPLLDQRLWQSGLILRQPSE